MLDNIRTQQKELVKTKVEDGEKSKKYASQVEKGRTQYVSKKKNATRKQHE